MSALTAKQVPYPVGTDAAASLDTIIQSLAEWVDTNPGIAAMTTIARDALPAAGKWLGRVILNTTTSELERYNGSVWVQVLLIGPTHLLANAVTTAAVVDSAITTAKIDATVGSVGFTASTLMKRDAAGRSQVANPAVAADIANKGYVDAIVATSGSVGVVRYAKFGGIVHVWTTAQLDSNVTLPVGFRPAQTITAAGSNYDGVNYTFRNAGITTSGIVVGTGVQFSVSYLAA